MTKVVERRSRRINTDTKEKNNQNVCKGISKKSHNINTANKASENIPN
jgi:hypothetical protein